METKQSCQQTQVGWGFQRRLSECQRERMNGQTKTILREKLQLYALKKMKERIEYFSYTTERDPTDIRQVQHRQPLRDSLNPDSNLDTFITQYSP